MALVTNSAFIVNWEDIHKHIQEPLPNCFLNSSQIDNRLGYLFKMNDFEVFPYLTDNSFNTNKNLSQYWQYEFDGAQLLVFENIGPTFYDLACDTRFYSVFREYRLVSDDTLQRAFAIMNSTNIETNAQTLDTVYRVGFELAHNILKIFWRPKTVIIDKVQNIFGNYFKDKFVIGMQMRFKYLERKDVSVFFECAKRIESKVRNKTVKWFISGDDEEKIETIKKVFPGKVITAPGKIAHVNEDLDGFERALIDIELLARTDETIITGGSTFGYDYI
jgi:hypothetical protein